MCHAPLCYTLPSHDFIIQPSLTAKYEFTDTIYILVLCQWTQSGWLVELPLNCQAEGLESASVPGAESNFTEKCHKETKDAFPLHKMIRNADKTQLHFQ